MKQPSVSKTGRCRIKSRIDIIENSPSPILSLTPNDDSYVKKTLDNDEREVLDYWGEEWD